MVISTVNQVTYNGDGINKAWPYTFQIIEPTDIRVKIINPNGTETEVSSDFYVDAVNNVVYYPGYAPGAEPPEEDQPPKLTSAEKIVVYRLLPLTQEADLGDKWPFFVIEKGLDKLTMLIQDWRDQSLKTVNGVWDALNRQIKNVEEPTDSSDAATKQYVDAAITGVVAAGNNLVYADNVASVKSADLSEGMYVATAGYSSTNDGCGANYLIRAKLGTDVDDYNNFTLDNGLFAERIYSNCLEVVRGSDIRGWKVYTSASSLGLNYNTMTLDQIFRAMPDYSKVIMYITMGATSFRRNPLPYYGTAPNYYGFGVLTITKTLTGGAYAPIAHCEFRDESRGNKQRIWTGTFYGQYNEDNPQLTDYRWTGWEEISAKPIDVPKNPQRCVDEMIEVADSYYGKGIMYGTTAASADTGSIAGFSGAPADMNCKLFVASVMEGIPYHYSKWYNAAYPLRYRDCYSWAMHPPREWSDFILWCWQNGWEVDPGINYGNLQKGDIVFYGGGYDRWGSKPAGGEDAGEAVPPGVQQNYEAGIYDETYWSYWKPYRAISHVGIVTGRWRTDGNGNKQPEIIQCTGNNASITIDGKTTTNRGIRYDYIDSLSIDSHAGQYIVMIIRMPLCETKAYNTVDYDKYVLNRKMLMSYYHKATLTIKGNSDPVFINVSTKNLAVYNDWKITGINTSTGAEVASTTSLATGFMPIDPVESGGSVDDGIIYNMVAGFDSVQTYYYDRRQDDGGFLGVGSSISNVDHLKARYVRRVYKKSDESTISANNLLEVKNSASVRRSEAPGGYVPGFGSTVKIPAVAAIDDGNNPMPYDGYAGIPDGAICKRICGKYCVSDNGIRWRPVNSTVNALLDGVYLYDGENNIRILSTQEVEIS